jgi:hypothetical protein
MRLYVCSLVFWTIIRDSLGSLLNERLVSEGLATYVLGVSDFILLRAPVLSVIRAS